MAFTTGQLSVLTTPELLQITGLTRVQLQRLENAAVLTPHRKGKFGRGHSGLWTIMQVVGAAYYKAFLDSNCEAVWGYAAAKWIARQNPGKIELEIATKNRVLVAIAPDGTGQMIEPYLKPGASREHKLLVAHLDLKPIYRRIMLRIRELADRLYEEECTTSHGSSQG